MKPLQEKLRTLPSVESLLQSAEVGKRLEKNPRWMVLDAIHQTLNTERERIRSGTEPIESAVTPETLLPRIDSILSGLASLHLRRVVNATGVVIHTNLGRSILTETMMKNVARIASGYSNLEYDLEAGRRGSRYSHVEDLLCRITGAEATLVVNNNAGAVLLGLNTLAEDREVIVSRGQLVEIGGSFRIPDVMKKSGCTLVEIGTTNKTHPADYENAVTDRTGTILKVHMSNFEMRGFTEEVGCRELPAIARKHHLPLMEDLGSGSLIDLSPYGLPKEPTVQESVKAGVDLVTFSGDKLLGGPQAGILVGSREILDRVKKNPLTRALRVDKMTLAALEITLRKYLDSEDALRSIPTLRMLTQSPETLEARAKKLARAITTTQKADLSVEVLPDCSQVGGGAFPEATLPTFVVTLQSASLSVNRLEEHFRKGDPPVIGRIRRGRFFLDVRTLREEEFEAVVTATDALAQRKD